LRSCRSGSWRQGSVNGIDEHDGGLSRGGQFTVDHLDRENRVIAAQLRSFAQGYDRFGNFSELPGAFALLLRGSSFGVRLSSESLIG